MPQKYGHLANQVDIIKTPCTICETPEPEYSWTDYSFQAYCVMCGTPYLLTAGKIPKIEIKETSISILKQYYQETKRGNGLGFFLGWDDYQDQLADRIAFGEWDDKRLLTSNSNQGTKIVIEYTDPEK